MAMMNALLLLSALSASLVGTFRSDGNCFNTSLITAGVMQQVRIITDQELVSYLKSCQEIPKPSKPGDIVVIMENSSSLKDTPIHTFTYLDEKNAFEKPDVTDKLPYRFNEIKNIFEEYDVPIENQFPTDEKLAEIFKSQNFHFFALSYRCRLD